jgi:hypothetical protein
MVVAKKVPAGAPEQEAPQAPLDAQAQGEAEPPTVLERIGRFLRPGPIRSFLSTHEVHLEPYSVAHGRRARRVAAGVIVALLVFSAWYWVIPRTDIHVQAQYHEGLFNRIDVDLRVINAGSIALSPLHVELVVSDAESGQAFAHYSINSSLAAHSTFDPPALTFKGDQIETNYNLSVKVSYNGGAPRTFDFRTEEPFMNLYFDGRIN